MTTSLDTRACEAVRQHAFEYLDEALEPSGAVAQAVRGHLAGCPACARLVRQLSRFRARLAALGDRAEQAPPEFRARLLARLAARLATQRPA
jgi:predicted anti-sigma-YlaC factor YlaD